MDEQIVVGAPCDESFLLANDVIGYCIKRKGHDGECNPQPRDPICSRPDCTDVERLRDALRAYPTFPSECIHGEEVWYCDGCQFAYEREVKEWLKIRDAALATGKPLSQHHGPYCYCHADQLASFTPKDPK